MSSLVLLTGNQRWPGNGEGVVEFHVDSSRNSFNGGPVHSGSSDARHPLCCDCPIPGREVSWEYELERVKRHS